MTPVLGGIVADQYLGKYNTILCFSVIYIIGLVILFCTSLPAAIVHGASLGGLVTTMVIVGLGTGGIKANISPLIAEQVDQKPRVDTLKSGERVIIDPTRTIERVCKFYPAPLRCYPELIHYFLLVMIFYMCINTGSLSAIATTELELHVGFWAAYLLPACMFVVAFTILIFGKKLYVVRPPKGSIIPSAFKVMWIGLMNRGNLQAATKSHQESSGGRYRITWSDHFVEEIRRALIACRVFAYGIPSVNWLLNLITDFESQVFPYILGLSTADAKQPHISSSNYGATRHSK